MPRPWKCFDSRPYWPSSEALHAAGCAKTTKGSIKPAAFPSANVFDQAILTGNLKPSMHNDGLPHEPSW
jgi:hypothetical protein